MNTFMQSETLKYLYLLFESSDVIPLDRESLKLRLLKHRSHPHFYRIRAEHGGKNTHYEIFDCRLHLAGPSTTYIRTPNSH